MSQLPGAALLVALVATSVAAGSLEIEVATVRVMPGGSPVVGDTDPLIIFLRRHLKRLTEYRSFEIVRREDRLCAWRSEEAFSIPGGRSLQIVPKGMEEEIVMMQVRLLDGHKRLVDTHVRLPNRGRLVFGVARRAGDEDGPMFIVLKAGR